MSAKMSRVPEPPPDSKTILCIDDHPEGLAVRKIFLETFGYQVHIAKSGREGLEMLSGSAVDIVLLDYRMPEMDGEAVAGQIRQNWPELPIVMLSGYVADIPPRVRQLVDAFVSKGSQPSELLDTLKNLLGPVPKKRPTRISEYSTVVKTAQEQIERNRALLQKTRDPLRRKGDKNGAT